MRILLVAPWDEESGGVASVVGNLARYLQSCRHEVIFLFPAAGLFLRSKVTAWGFPGFELRMQPPFGARHSVISLMAFLFLFPIILFQLIRFIRKYHIQIVNIHYPAEAFFYFAVLRRILDIKLVISVHGADIFPDGKAKDKYSRTMLYLLSSSDLVVGNSLAFRKDFITIFPNLQGKTIFIHNGVDLYELTELKAEDTRTSDHGQYLLCIAAHNPKKAIDVLIRAFASIEAIAPICKLLLAGDGPLRKQLEELALTLRADKRIEFLGWQTRTEIVKILRGCTAFVLPSRSEPFGIAVIEALACSKPVIATKVGGIPEIIENGKNGILVEPDDTHALAEALTVVLTNPALQKTLAANGYVTVDKFFRCEHTGAAYEAVFADILAMPAGSEASEQVPG